MNFKPFNIMVALVFRGDERPVISQSVFFTEKLNAQLTIIHVNQPALSQPKGKIAKHIDEDAIREKITAYSFEKILNKFNFNLTSQIVQILLFMIFNPSYVDIYLAYKISIVIFYQQILRIFFLMQIFFLGCSPNP